MPRKALLIGSQIRGLEGPHNDVAAIRKLLEKQGFERTEITECVAGDATRDGILTAYRALIARTEADDVAVVYYSGHGGFADDKTGRRVQYILPTDWVDDEDVFHGIVDAELSDLLAQLTSKTSNATVILDCCHASLLSRGFVAAQPTGLVSRVVPGKWTAGLAALVAVSPPHPYGTGNPNAVRLVATEADREAFEADVIIQDTRVRRGLFTRALERVLEEPTSTLMSWRAICDRVREDVQGSVRTQVPSVEGPADRVVFTTEERMRTDAVVYFEDAGRPAIRASRILGARVGGVYDIVRIGETEPTVATIVATATITALTGAIAHVTLSDEKEQAQPGTLAFPRTSPFPAIGSVLVGDDNPELRERLARTAFVEVVDERAARFRIETTPAGLVLIDRVEPPYATFQMANDKVGREACVRRIERWAKAEALRALQPGGLADTSIDLSYGVAVNGALAIRGRTDPFRVGERVCVRAKNLTSKPLYMWMVGIGVAGKVSLISGVPIGRGIEPGAIFSIGEDDNQLVGIELSWPADLATDLGPRRETIAILYADHWFDATIFETPVLSRGLSALEERLNYLRSGITREMGRKQGGQRFGISLIHFDLIPSAVHDGSARSPIATEPRNEIQASPEGSSPEGYQAVSLPADRPLAIVIGVASYARSEWQLRTAATDAEALATVLKRDHGYDVILRRDGDATRDKLRNLFGAELRALISNRRRLLVYFAGHGIAEDSVGNIAGYLVPQDGDDDLGSLFSMQELADGLRAVACHHLLVILDCCFAGAFNWAATRDLDRPPVMYKERFELYLSSPTWQVFTSAAHNQRAADVLDGRTLGERDETAGIARSPFLQALLDGLSGQADISPKHADGTSGDGIITATELYMFTREQVEPHADHTGRPQTPMLWRVRQGDLGEYLFFAPLAQPRLIDAPALTEETCPYRGMESYDEQHGTLLFGRDRVIRELTEHALRQPITIVIGASGVGKSSLVKAGLLPALRRCAPMPTILGPMRPGDRPLAALTAALACRPVDHAAACYLVVDQLEEVVTMTTSARERDEFLAQLANLPADGIRVVATLRSDFEPSLWIGRLRAVWTDARFPVPDLTQDELREVVVRPAEANVLVFDPPELVDRLVNAVLGAPGSLPLLSFTLKYLYSEMVKRATGDRKLRGTDYMAVAPDGQALGVLGALQRSAGALVGRLDEPLRATLHAILLRMLTPQGQARARRRVPLRELESASADENHRIGVVLDELSAPKLRMVVRGADLGGPYAEPAHDAVLLCWPDVQRALDEPNALDELLLLRAVTRAAFEWKDTSPNRGLLWAGHARLSEALRLLERAPLRMNRVESVFLLRSRLGRRIRLVAALALTIALAVGSAVIYARTQTAREATLHAQDTQLDAAGARAGVRAETAGQERAALIDAITSLRTAIDSKRPIAPSVTTGATIAIGRYHRVALLPQEVIATIACARDGSRIVASAATAAVVARADGSTERELPSEPGDPIMAAAITPAGDVIVTASYQGRLVIWDAATGAKRTENTVPAASSMAVAISTDGSTVALAAEDGRVLLWPLGGPTTTIGTFTGGARSVAFSPDGSRLAASGSDGGARIWSVASRTEVFAASVIDAGIFPTAVAFSPDGARLLTIGGVARLWDIGTQQPVGELRLGVGLGDKLARGAFSNDGAEILTVGVDQVARRWNARTYNKIDTIFVGASPNTSITPCGTSRVAVSHGFGNVVILDLSHDNALATATSGERRDAPVMALAPASDGGWYAALETEKGAAGRLEHWDLQHARSLVFELPASPSAVTALRSRGFAIATHSELLTVDAAGKIQRREFLTGLSPTGFPPATSALAVGRAAFSSDGEWLIAPALRGVAGGQLVYANRVWNVATGAVEQELPGGSSGVFFGAGSFSAGGRTVAMQVEPGARRYQAQIVDRATKATVAVLARGKEPLLSVTLSPRGDRAAVTGAYGTVTIWQIATQLPITQLFGHTGVVWSASFSPDGTQLVTGGDDGTARLWDAATGAQVALYTGHTDAIWAVQFTADGSQLITGGLDGATRVYPTRPADILALACKRLDGDPEQARVCR